MWLLLVELLPPTLNEQLLSAAKTLGVELEIVKHRRRSLYGETTKCRDWNGRNRV